MTQGKSTRKIRFYLISWFGAVIRMTIIGMGCGALAHMLTGANYGPRYWIASLLVVGIYLLGAILEFAGDLNTKKDKQNDRP